MIKAVVFEDKRDSTPFYRATTKLEEFCKTHGVGKEQIVSISLSNGDQFGAKDKILLVFEE